MEFRLLGPLEVAADDGTPIALGGKRPRTLLAALLLHPNETVSTDALVEAIWGSRPPASAQSALQVHVHALRRALGADRIVTRAPGYSIRVEPGELDVDRFDELVQAGSFRGADALWRGPALADFAYEDFARSEAARLEERRLTAIESRVDAELAAGRHRELVAELDALVAERPERETLQAQRMLALYRSGRQTDALEAFRVARTALAESGLDPGPELRALERRILEHDPSLALPATADGPQHGLIGRDLELVAIAALLRDPATRLVTLTGPGGTGKTTLARAAAANAGGAPFVDLAAVHDPGLVVSAIATALGVEELPGESVVRTIARHLDGDAAQLVVLDNLEHLPGSYAAIAELLDGAPLLRALATSRTPLRVALEREFRVQPLATPALGDTDSEAIAATAAVRLYATRARELVPDLALDGASLEAVGRITRALDGLPLAIELAAARVRVFGVEGTARRIGEALSILTRTSPDLPERQRSLRATIEWSARLLDRDELELLRVVAVFAGGASLESVEEVAGADGAALVLERLLDASLVTSTFDASGRPRFSLLETIRAYVLNDLPADEARELRTRHLAWCIDVAEDDEPRYWLRGTAWLDRMEPELPNVRAALDFARDEGDLVGEARLASSLRHLWRVRGHLVEGRSRLEDVLARSSGTEVDPRLRARLLHETAVMRNVVGEFDGARALWLEALALYEELGDAVEVGRVNSELGTCALAAGDLETAIPYCRAAAQGEGTDEFTRLIALGNLAECYEQTGELDLARATALEVLQAQTANGDRDGVAYMSHSLTSIELARGDLRQAHRHLVECLAVTEEIGFVELTGYALGLAAALAIELGADEEAGLLLGASLECFARTGAAPQAREQARNAAVLDTLAARLEGVAALVERGRALELPVAVELARGLAAG